MMILTNGLTDVADEGFLKVANSLVKRMKKAFPEVEIVSYERRSDITDTFIDANKFMINKCVRAACARHDDVLYIPFPSRKWMMALRVFLLSRFSKRLRVVLVLKTPIGAFGKILLKHSGAGIVVLSRDAADFYGDIVGAQRVTYLKTGVDTKKFAPVSKEQVAELKKKYGFDSEQKIVLHVGHLNQGRNLRTLLQISDEYQVLLVTSTLTKNEADSDLRKELLLKPNIRVIDDYVPNIEELYQLSDVYFFPVVESGKCIDVPLSCLEAAACNKLIVTTRFGEMKEFVGQEGYFFIETFETDTLNQKIDQALHISTPSIRMSVLDYDWCVSINKILKG